MFNLKFKFCIIVFILMLSISIFGVFQKNKSNIYSSESTSKFHQSKSLKIFSDTIFAVNSLYYKDISIDSLLNKATKGIIDSLDEHSYFISDDKNLYSQKSNLSGIGLSIEHKDNKFIVITSLKDSPAFKKDIKSGDIITHINNTSTQNMTLSELSHHLVGKKGSFVSLSLKRKNKYFRVSVVRNNILSPSLEKNIFNDIGYIKINYFDKDTADIFQTAIIKLKKRHIKGLIIDVRNNPGGYVDSALKISSSLINAGNLIIINERHRSSPEIIKATEGDIMNNLPIVVMINQGSASAAEILSGSLQENNRAIILGSRSYGKSTIQSIIKINQNSFLKITTGKYLLPSGKSIEGKGIEPDVFMPYTCLKDCTSHQDQQLIRSLGLINKYYNKQSTRNYYVS